MEAMVFHPYLIGNRYYYWRIYGLVLTNIVRGL